MDRLEYNLRWIRVGGRQWDGGERGGVRSGVCMCLGAHNRLCNTSCSECSGTTEQNICVSSLIPVVL